MQGRIWVHGGFIYCHRNLLFLQWFLMLTRHMRDTNYKYTIPAYCSDILFYQTLTKYCLNKMSWYNVRTNCPVYYIVLEHGPNTLMYWDTALSWNFNKLKYTRTQFWHTVVKFFLTHYKVWLHTVLTVS